MRITRDMEIAGVPAVELRNAFKWLQQGDCFDADNLAHCLTVPANRAAKVFSELLELGYFVPSEHFKGHYVLSDAGGALANAHATKPIERSTAQRLLNEALARARCINEDPNRLFVVSEIGVFGSYLSDAQELGDLDLAVVLARRPGAGAFPQADIEYAEQAQAKGRRFKHYFDMCNWAHEETLREIKKSSGYISIHLPDDLILSQTRVERVLKFKS